MAAAPSPRTRVRRVPARADYERATVAAILDAALVCHLGFVDGGQPYVVPTLHARVADVVYVHGSAAGRATRALAGGAPVCLTVTCLDGLVLARSAFHHSVNYRSALVLGTARAVEPQAERLRALEAFTERLVPGRWAHVREPSRQELRATCVLALALDEASAKVRTGPPVDAEEDVASSAAWAGTIALRTVASAPMPDPALDPAIALPDHVARWAPP